jgi:predicted nuclease of predicted toxin-antitoxin system
LPPIFVPLDGKSFSAGIRGVKGFLLDENLPYRLRFRPAGLVTHSRDLGENVSDDRLWKYARLNDLVIVSKDVDFSLVSS